MTVTSSLLGAAASQVGSNTVNYATDQAIDKIKSSLKNETQSRKFDTELERTSTVFHKNLQKSLKQVAKERNNSHLEQVADEWDPTEMELTGVDLTYESKSKAVDQVCEAVESHINDKYDVRVDDLELRTAIETAYADALVQFADEIEGTDLAERLQQEFSRDLIAEIRGITEQLEVIDRYLGRYEDFVEIHPQRNDDVHSEITQNLADGDYYQEYVLPENLRKEADTQKMLVVGRAGTGKTRALLETLDKIDLSKFDRIIIPTESFNTLSDVEPLRNRSYGGDVLILWDDIHEFTEADEAVEAVLQKLNRKINDDGHNLWIRTTIRREEFGAVFEDQDRPGRLSSGFWGDFSTATVDTSDYFTEDRIEVLVDDGIEKYDLTVPNHLKQKFVKQVVDTDPSPAYVDVICQTVSDKSDRVVTAEYLEELPEDILDAWKHRCEQLAAQEPSRYDVLRTISIVSQLQLPLNTALLQYLYTEWLNGERTFSMEMEYLESRGWFTTQETGSTREIRIHDLRLEAIAETVQQIDEKPGELLELSEALSSSHFELILSKADTHPDLPAIVHVRFGKFLADALGEFDEFLNTARSHFEQATSQDTRTPEVHLTYAIFLADQEEFEEAAEQYRIANSIGISISTARKQDALDEIQHLVETNDLPQIIGDISGVIIEQWEDSMGFMGRNGRVLGGAAVILTCKQIGDATTLNQIAEAMRLTEDDFPNMRYEGDIDQYIKKRVNKAQQAIARRLGYGLQPIHPEQLIKPFCTELQSTVPDTFSDSSIQILIDTSEEILSTISQADPTFVSGHNPNSIAIAAIWLSGQLTDTRVKQDTLTDIAGMTNVSLRTQRNRMIKFFVENDISVEQWATTESLAPRVKTAMDKQRS